jgi:hypothetical protein
LENDNIEYNQLKSDISYLYHTILKNKIKRWVNGGTFFVKVNDIGNITLFGSYICICFYALSDYQDSHLHINSDGSVDNSVNIEILPMQYELLKKFIICIV